MRESTIELNEWKWLKSIHQI